MGKVVQLLDVVVSKRSFSLKKNPHDSLDDPGITDEPHMRTPSSHASRMETDMMPESHKHTK
jgi:hypothetical protein